MNIALLGYGKMGKSIEQIAINRNHHISLKIDTHTDLIDFSNTDVAIDFSLPNTAVDNIKKAIKAGIPVISGTTGWLDSFNDVVAYCEENNGAFIYASNFSLGVNLFFELNRQLSKMLAKYNEYHCTIEEIHHTQKLDAPSGTAISLANDIINNTKYTGWALNPTDNENTIPISALRQPEVPGTHEVAFSSNIDTISIKHTAHNRTGFALGAVIAAEWLIGKKGVFTMKDVLNIG